MLLFSFLDYGGVKDTPLEPEHFLSYSHYHFLQASHPRCAAHNHKHRQSKVKQNFECFIAKVFHSHSVS